MRTKPLFRSFTLVLLILVVLAPAAVVSAAPPVVETGFVDYSYKSDLQPCPDLEVYDHEVFTYRQTTYFDNQGNQKSIKFHAVGTDNFYNPENPGVVLSGSFSITLEFSPTWEVLSAHGLSVHITVPGYGTVLVRAGLWSQYPFGHLAGKDSLEDPKDIAAFCSLLRGN